MTGTPYDECADEGGEDLVTLLDCRNCNISRLEGELHIHGRRNGMYLLPLLRHLTRVEASCGLEVHHKETAFVYIYKRPFFCHGEYTARS